MKQFFIRLFNLMFGVFLIALGVVANIKANIGYAPWEVFHVGLSKTTGISFGAAALIIGIIVIVIVTLLKEKFGLGTILSMILFSVFVDLIFLVDVMPVAEHFIVGLAMLIAGAFTISIGTRFYIKSAFGAGPRDNLMVVLTRKTKLPVGVCRGMVEVVVTLIGWALGGMVGVGTIISALAAGPCIQITFRVFKFDVKAVKHETLADTFRFLAGKISRGKTNP